MLDAPSTIDWKKDLKTLYSPLAKQVVVLDVPQMHFLMVDGSGDPNISPEYRQALDALYGVSYTLKFMIKKSGGPSYQVSPLEGLWWADDMAVFDVEDKSLWKWTMMVMQPSCVTPDSMRQAVADLAKKKDPQALARVRLESFHEGLSAQIMHLGPYAAEAPTIERLHAFIRDNGYRTRARHHEIYLGDPRKSAPEKLRTILRQPIEQITDPKMTSVEPISE